MSTGSRNAVKSLAKASVPWGPGPRWCCGQAGGGHSPLGPLCLPAGTFYSVYSPYTAEYSRTALSTPFRGIAPTSSVTNLCSPRDNSICGLQIVTVRSRVVPGDPLAPTAGRASIHYPAREPHEQPHTCGALLPVAAALLGRPVRRRSPAAQTPYSPYSGRTNPLRHFRWSIYTTTFGSITTPRSRRTWSGPGYAEAPPHVSRAEARSRLQVPLIPSRPAAGSPAAERHSKARRRSFGAALSLRATASSCNGRRRLLTGLSSTNDARVD